MTKIKGKKKILDQKSFRLLWIVSALMNCKFYNVTDEHSVRTLCKIVREQESMKSILDLIK